MAENPLLPNAELRALHTSLRAASLPNSSVEATGPSRTRRRSPFAGLEALLASTLLQLQPQDVLLPPPNVSDLNTFLSPKRSGNKSQGQVVVSGLRDESPRLALAAGLASGLRRSSSAASAGLVLAFATSGAKEREWAKTLTWAQQELLPLVLVCADPSGPDALRAQAATDPEALTWGPLQRVANRAKLPVLTVDGQDAVAVYRVIQESALRARSGGGPAVIWAVLPQAGESRRLRSAEPTPLARLEHYLQTRKIAFG